jgi:hypothetical protein
VIDSIQVWDGHGNHHVELGEMIGLARVSWTPNDDGSETTTLMFASREAAEDFRTRLLDMEGATIGGTFRDTTTKPGTVNHAIWFKCQIDHVRILNAPHPIVIIKARELIMVPASVRDV